MKVFAFFIFLMFQTLVFADPTTARQASDWVENIRFKKRDPTFDVGKDAMFRASEARQKLALNASDEESKRDLADALHALGHLAEHEHKFELAIELHSESLKLFQETSFKTRDSGSGVLHSLTHIFKNIYDFGIAHLLARRYMESIEWLQKAKVFFEENKMSELIYADRERSAGSKESNSFYKYIPWTIEHAQGKYSCKKFYSPL